MQKNFDDWNHLKKDINHLENHRLLILKKYNQFSFLGVALTTTTKESLYKFPIGVVEGKESFVNLSQLRYLDSRHLTNKIKTLEKDIFLATK